MALLGKAVLGVWNEVDPAVEDSFNDWYVREHIPERTEVPGMVRGRRYRALEGSPRYMAFYEALTLDVLTGGAYRTQLANPTPWTRHVMAGFRFAQRGICTVLASSGDGIGGLATVVHVQPAPGGEAQLRGWMEDHVCRLPGMKQVAAAHAWAVAPGEPESPTSQLAANAARNPAVHWVLAIEATEMDALTAARGAVLASDPVAHGAANVQPYPLYRLLYCLERRGR